MVKNSNGIVIQLDDVLVPNVQNLSINVNLSLIEVTTAPSDAFVQRIVDRKSAIVNFDSILDTVDINRFTGGQNVRFRLGDITSAYEASGFISSIEQTGGTDDVPMYSVSIETTGAVTEFIRLLLADLCTTDGQTICTTAGEIICVSVVAQEIVTNLQDHLGNILLDSLGEPITTIVRIT